MISGPRRLVGHWHANTISDRPRLEVVSALLLAPLVEEVVFRAAFFRLARVVPSRQSSVGLGSAVVFGLMHARFGRWFMGYAFVGGLVLWATYARTGYWGAVLVHMAANVVDLSIGLRRYLYATSGRAG